MTVNVHRRYFKSLAPISLAVFFVTKLGLSACGGPTDASETSSGEPSTNESPDDENETSSDSSDEESSEESETTSGSEDSEEESDTKSSQTEESDSSDETEESEESSETTSTEESSSDDDSSEDSSSETETDSGADCRDEMTEDIVAIEATCLEWQRRMPEKMLPWSEGGAEMSARQYCEMLDLSGTGWRLPTLEELESIVVAENHPAIDAAMFPDTPGWGFWSSEEEESSHKVWAIDFNNAGMRAMYGPDGAQWFRCVRNSK